MATSGLSAQTQLAVAWVVAENLAAMIPTDQVAIFPWRSPWTAQFRVTVDIARFDGPLGGPADLTARWRLLDESRRWTRCER